MTENLWCIPEILEQISKSSRKKLKKVEFPNGGGLELLFNCLLYVNTSDILTMNNDYIPTEANRLFSGKRILYLREKGVCLDIPSTMLDICLRRYTSMEALMYLNRVFIQGSEHVALICKTLFSTRKSKAKSKLKQITMGITFFSEILMNPVVKAIFGMLFSVNSLEKFELEFNLIFLNGEKMVKYVAQHTVALLQSGVEGILSFQPVEISIRDSPFDKMKKNIQFLGPDWNCNRQPYGKTIIERRKKIF
eukprot:snap_masked-scaffold_44-processed-gene-1.49-mRNA-1 protein AED:1.00 eAED:1.00 QI:0/0/0/0/1/1/2/0/249